MYTISIADKQFLLRYLPLIECPSTREFDDPETLNLERWQRTSQAERPTGQYFPFGAGPHSASGDSSHCLRHKPSSAQLPKPTD